MDTDLDRPVRPEDFNKINSVAIFMGPLMDMYKTIQLSALNSLIGLVKRVTLLDVGTRDAFKERAVEGVVNIPLEFIERDAHGIISEDDVVVVYGEGGIGSPLSAVAVDRLFTIGYEKLFRFDGTVEEWKKAGELIETGTRALKKAA